MNTLRSLAAFGLMVFTISVFSTTQTLGAQPTCPCSPEIGLLPGLIAAGFPPASDLDPAFFCDTHPKVIGLGVGLVVDAFASSTFGPELLVLDTIVDPAAGEGRCNFQDAGGLFLDSISAEEAWRCIREVADACRVLGYKGGQATPSP